MTHDYEVSQTAIFTDWLDDLRDRVGQKRIVNRIVRLQAGNFGDCKSVGGPVQELRIAHGPGYRVYFTVRGGKLVILLCGGDKSTQSKGINRAREMAGRLP